MLVRRPVPGSSTIVWLALLLATGASRGAEAQTPRPTTPAQTPAPVAPPVSAPAPTNTGPSTPPASTGAVAPAPASAASEPEGSPLLPTEPPPPPPPGAPQIPAEAPIYPPAYVPPQPQGYGPYTPEYADGYGEPVDPRAPDDGAYAHEGFFLRFNVGIGAGGATYKERLDDARVSRVKTRGFEGMFELAIGGTVADDFILHGNVMVVSMSSNKTVDGVEERDYDDLSTSMYLLGGGGTYYFRPANVYLTASVGLGGLVERRELKGDRDFTDDIESGAGVGTAIGVGKEWWVGRRGEWGIGAALMGAFYAAPLDIAGEQSTFRGHSVSLTFSATLN